MNKWLRDLALCFSAGAAAGAAKGFLVWLCNYYSITAVFGAYLAAGLSPAGLYARVVWGGIFGFLFLLPPARGSWWLSGLLWGAVASLSQLIILPLLTHGSPHLAMNLVLATVCLNSFWGCVAALMLRWTR